eukprot:UN23002
MLMHYLLLNYRSSLLYLLPRYHFQNYLVLDHFQNYFLIIRLGLLLLKNHLHDEVHLRRILMDNLLEYLLLRDDHHLHGLQLNHYAVWYLSFSFVFFFIFLCLSEEGSVTFSFIVSILSLWVVSPLSSVVSSITSSSSPPLSTRSN